MNKIEINKEISTEDLGTINANLLAGIDFLSVKENEYNTEIASLIPEWKKYADYLGKNIMVSYVKKNLETIQNMADALPKNSEKIKWAEQYIGSLRKWLKDGYFDNAVDINDKKQEDENLDAAVDEFYNKAMTMEVPKRENRVPFDKKITNKELRYWEILVSTELGEIVGTIMEMPENLTEICETQALLNAKETREETSEKLYKLLDRLIYIAEWKEMPRFIRFGARGLYDDTEINLGRGKWIDLTDKKGEKK